jgi:hypothetical protein
MNFRSILTGFGIFICAHLMTWFQLNGQFLKTDWFRNNYFILSLFGIPISYAYMYGTKYCYEGYGGIIWPGRFTGFAAGMIVFTTLTALILNEGVTLKTGVSLILATALVAVQVLWK